jgi:hypothetical protein
MSRSDSVGLRQRANSLAFRLDLLVNVWKNRQIQEISQSHAPRNEPLEQAFGGSELGLHGACLFGEFLLLLGQPDPFAPHNDAV